MLLIVVTARASLLSAAGCGVWCVHLLPAALHAAACHSCTRALVGSLQSAAAAAAAAAVTFSVLEACVCCLRGWNAGS